MSNNNGKIDDRVLYEACLREVWPRHSNFTQVYRKLVLECSVRTCEDLITACRATEGRFAPLINMIIRERSSSKIELGEDSVNALIVAYKDVSTYLEKKRRRTPAQIYVTNLPSEALEMFWFCNEILQEESKVLSREWRDTAVYILVEDMKIKNQDALWRVLTSNDEQTKTSLSQRFDNHVTDLFLRYLTRKKKIMTHKFPSDSILFRHCDNDTIPGIGITRVLIAAESVLHEIRHLGARTKYVNRDTESEGRNRFCREFGQYFCDCSGFVCALLKETLNMEITSIGGFHSDRPYLRARDFCAFFRSRDNASNRLSLERGAWRRVSNLDRVKVMKCV